MPPEFSVYASTNEAADAARSALNNIPGVLILKESNETDLISQPREHDTQDENKHTPFARWLRLKRGGLSLNQFSRLTHISASMLSYFENDISLPSPSSLNQLSQALGEDSDQLHIISGFWPFSRNAEFVKKALGKLKEAYSPAELPGEVVRRRRRGLPEAMKVRLVKFAAVNTQREMADACEVSQSFISSIERGKSSPTPEFLDKIAARVHCDRDILYAIFGFWPPSLPNDPKLVDYITD